MFWIYGRASVLPVLSAGLVSTRPQALAEDAAASLVQTRILGRQASLDSAAKHLRRLSRLGAVATAAARRVESGSPAGAGHRAAVAGGGLGAPAAGILRGVDPVAATVAMGWRSAAASLA